MDEMLSERRCDFCGRTSAERVFEVSACPRCLPLVEHAVGVFSVRPDQPTCEICGAPAEARYSWFSLCLLHYGALALTAERAVLTLSVESDIAAVGLIDWGGRAR